MNFVIKYVSKQSQDSCITVPKPSKSVRVCQNYSKTMMSTSETVLMPKWTYRYAWQSPASLARSCAIVSKTHRLYRKLSGFCPSWKKEEDSPKTKTCLWN